MGITINVAAWKAFMGKLRGTLAGGDSAARPLLAEQGGDLSGVLPASCATRLELSHREQDREPGSRAFFGAAGALSRARRCDPDAIRLRPGSPLPRSWRRHPDLNRGITDLQSVALP